MPKRLKKPVRPKRPSDPNQWAHQLVQESTTEPEPALPPSAFRRQLSDYMKELGKRGGTESGKRRMENLTAEQRQEIALKAARARWAKRKKR